MSATTTRDRSYNVRRDIQPGSRVRFTEPQNYYSDVLPVGTEGTVVSYSNAGFAGITAAVRLDDGTNIYGMSAGKLERA